jgi:hypothetical protein
VSRVRYAHIDLVCDRLHKSRVFLGSDEDLPPCAACGARTYPKDEGPGTDAHAVHTFKPFEVDGGVRITSEEGALRYRQSVAERKGVPVEHIQFNSRGNVKERVEEIKHEAIVKRRESGFDERQFADYRAQQNRVNAEKAGRPTPTNPFVGHRSQRG